MKETFRMFSHTREVIEQRAKDIEAKMKGIASNLRQFGRDGDKIDDPRMFELLEQQQLLRRDLDQLRLYLNPESETVDAKGLEDKLRISVGHQVRLKTTYEDGFEQELTITIGTKIDSQFLWQNREFFRDNHLLISENAPLARSLLNAEEGQTVSFRTADVVGKAEVLKIEISPLARKK